MSFTARFNSDFVRGFIRPQNRNLYDIDGFILLVSLRNGEEVYGIFNEIETVE